MWLGNVRRNQVHFCVHSVADSRRESMPVRRMTSWSGPREPTRSRSYSSMNASRAGLRQWYWTDYKLNRIYKRTWKSVHDNFDRLICSEKVKWKHHYREDCCSDCYCCCCSRSSIEWDWQGVAGWWSKWNRDLIDCPERIAKVVVANGESWCRRRILTAKLQRKSHWNSAPHRSNWWTESDQHKTSRSLFTWCTQILFMLAHADRSHC